MKQRERESGKEGEIERERGGESVVYETEPERKKRIRVNNMS